MKNILSFIKKEAVFSIATILAVAAVIITGPTIKVVNGIDFRVLALLFSLMAVVAGLQRQLVFKRIGNYLLSKFSHTRSIYLLLIYMCFFTSMLLTNDVALITFVPFTIMLLPMIGKDRQMILIIVLQTIAANLGSMLTPLGNPQNLYLYGLMNCSLLDFIKMMFPLWIVSFILVTLPILFIKNENIENPRDTILPKRDKKKETIYALLFVLCLLSVVRVIPYYVLLALILVAFLIIDKKVLINVDYILLMTFVSFFIFVFHIKRIDVINDWLMNIMDGHTFVTGLASSQFISNVPAAVLLSGFTSDYKLLTYAVDIGGLGTLIASMASLISYKLYCASNNSKPLEYFIKFTIYNILYLIILATPVLIYIA